MITLSEIKQFLNISTSDDDTLLETYEGYVTGTLESLIDNKIDQIAISDEILETVDEFDLHPKLELELRNNPIYVRTMYYPVTNLSVEYNGTALAITDDYVVDTDLGLISIYDYVSDYKNYLLASYTAGYATVPSDLKLVALEIVKELYENSGASNKGDGKVKSKSIGDFSVTYDFGTSVVTKYSGVINKYKSMGV